MSSEVLREAAALMRKRAEAVKSFSDAKTGTPLPWVKGLYGQVFDMGAAPVSVSDRPEDAEHIASWHPAVALAVADCLDAAARMWPPDPHEPREGCPDCSWIAVARAYLGELS